MTESAGGIVAIDIGGSGSRAVWHPLDGSAPVSVDGPRLRVTRSGANLSLVVGEIVDRLVGDLDRVGVRFADAPCRAVGVGATGVLSLTSGVDDVHDLLHERMPAARSLIVSDAVTAAVGALGGEPGAVVAAGTGAIAFGTDMAGIWHRVDGWGHVLGDQGAGSWLGASALRLAAEQFDGRRTDAAAVFERATARFGPVTEWPRMIYTSDERAGILASVVPDVIGLAADGDSLAVELCQASGRELARSLSAALVDGVPHRVSWTGGLFRSGEVIAAALGAELHRLVPDAEVREAEGSPLDGALYLARGMVSESGAPALASTSFATWRERAGV